MNGRIELHRVTARVMRLRLIRERQPSCGQSVGGADTLDNGDEPVETTIERILALLP